MTALAYLSQETKDELARNILVSEYYYLARGIKNKTINDKNNEFLGNLLSSFETVLRYYLSGEELQKVKDLI